MYKEQLVQPLFAYKNNIYKCTQISPSSLQIRRVLWWFIYRFFFPEFIAFPIVKYPVVRVSRALVQPFYFVFFSLVYSLTSYKYIIISTGFYCYLFRTEVFDWNTAFEHHSITPLRTQPPQVTWLTGINNNNTTFAKLSLPRRLFKVP